MSEGMNALVKLWTNSDRLAEYLCFEVGAFSYLLDQLTTNPIQPRNQKYTKLSSLSSHSNDPSSNSDPTTTNTPLDELKPSECAKKVVAHNLIHCPSDWSVNRKGNRCRLVFVIL